MRCTFILALAILRTHFEAFPRADRLVTIALATLVQAWAKRTVICDKVRRVGTQVAAVVSSISQYRSGLAGTRLVFTAPVRGAQALDLKSPSTPLGAPASGLS